MLFPPPTVPIFQQSKENLYCASLIYIFRHQEFFFFLMRNLLIHPQRVSSQPFTVRIRAKVGATMRLADLTMQDLLIGFMQDFSDSKILHVTKGTFAIYEALEQIHVLQRGSHVTKQSLASEDGGSMCTSWAHEAMTEISNNTMRNNKINDEM